MNPVLRVISKPRVSGRASSRRAAVSVLRPRARADLVWSWSRVAACRGRPRAGGTPRAGLGQDSNSGIYAKPGPARGPSTEAVTGGRPGTAYTDFKLVVQELAETPTAPAPSLPPPSVCRQIMSARRHDFVSAKIQATVQKAAAEKISRAGAGASSRW